MSSSALVTYTKLSPNHSGKRTHKIDTITIHCMAGNASVETCGALFAKSATKASSNYGIGSDGRIALYVDEANRSWASSNAANDQRAVTIEVANCGGAPDWPVSEKAYAALLDLLVDICRRNGIQKLLWKGDKSLIGQVDKQNMTVHRWFAAKACPGDWLYSRHGQIAEEVNKRLAGEKTNASPQPGEATSQKEEPELTETEIRKIVREEMAKVEAERAAQPVAAWAAKELDEAKARGITDGSRPRSGATRYEVALMAGRAAEQLERG